MKRNALVPAAMIAVGAVALLSGCSGASNPDAGDKTVLQL